MKKQKQALISTAMAVVVISAVTLGLNYKNGLDTQRREEIDAYLQQFKPTIPEGAIYAEADNLLPDRATTSNIEKNATLIVRGKVIDVSDPYRDTHGIPNHKISLEVSSVLKGDQDQVGKTVEIEILGGIIDERVFWSSDSPSFKSGEEVIVFLTKGETYYFVPFQAFGKVTIDDKGIATGIDENLGVFQKSVSEYESELRDYIK